MHDALMSHVSPCTAASDRSRFEQCVLKIHRYSAFLTLKRRFAAPTIWGQGSLRCVALSPGIMGITAHLGPLLHRLGPLSELPFKNHQLQ